VSTQLSPQFEKFRRWYVAVAVTILNCLLVALLLGGIFLLVRAIKGAFAANTSPVEKKYGDKIFTAYPGWSKDDVRALLSETWSRPSVFEPFTQFKERPFAGRFVNVSADGFRHSSDQAAWPPDTNAFNVFVFGGSTTFGYGLPDAETVPSFLQSWLRTNASPRMNVYNFGRAYYFSSQEIVLFLRLLAAGHVPQLAVFVDGLNDSLYVEDVPRFSDRVSELMAGRKSRVSLPAVQDENPSEQGGANDPSRNIASKVVRRYQSNMQLAKALGEAYGVRVAFVWQPIPTYKYDLQYHHFKDEGFVRHKNAPAVYELMNQNRSELAKEAFFIWCADLQEGIAESFYLDEVHYNPALARRLAARIGEELQARGLLAARPR
jgi:lysophospholipase L1-like esterase